MKRILVLFIMLLASLSLCAQGVTKVRGIVTDAETGEPIPFAAVFFKDTSIGLTTDIDGKYTLETREPVEILVCQLLGYNIQEKPVKQGAFSEVNFSLTLTDNRLSGAVVKADNSRVRRLLDNIDAHRDRNDPDRRPYYTCQMYNKMEMDITNAREQLESKWFNKQFGFVFDYMDTSAVSGMPYLPALLSETVLERRHCSSPRIDNETIVANRISGINPDHNLLTQFTGSMHMNGNFYDSYIDFFNVEFPSPAQKGGMLYYNYFIVDSLQVDGRKTYVVRYHPKPLISSPAFDGEMRIDAEEYAIRSVRAKMDRGGNVNWVRDIVIESDYRRLSDSTWFYDKDRLYADFSIALGDSSHMMSVIGTRQMDYMQPDFSVIEDMQTEYGMVKVLEDATKKSDEYWAQTRPYELTQNEQNIYKMVDQVQQTSFYKGTYKVTYSLVNNYFDIGPIGIGPLFNIYSNNRLEGPRPQIGLNTSRNLSTDFRIAGYVAYGFRDKQWKWGLKYEQLFQREPQRKLTAVASYDIHQLGKGLSDITSGNLLSSIWAKETKPAPMSEFSVRYDHEFSMQVNGVASVALKRYYSNPYVPMETWDGQWIPSVATNEWRLKLRFSKEETVNRGYYEKSYVYSEYPIVSLDFQGSIPGLREGDVGFFMPQLHMDWKFRIPPIGMSDMHFRAGTIVGQVPWTLLNLYAGNATMMTDKSAFSCMEYFEFASDTWATLMWYHSFNGFFLGKIPLIRELQLREEMTVKVAYGTLRDQNNGSDPKYGAMMKFPYGTQGLDGVPYVELGAGLSNIFRMLRVDFIWRVTHREKTLPDGSVVLYEKAKPIFAHGDKPLWPNAPKWFPNAVNIGLEVRF